MKTVKNKQAITFLSGSAGELDWMLPILDYLSKLQFKIKIVYLSRRAQKSIDHNLLLTNFINQPGKEIETISCGSYFFELIEKCGYLMHRINIKLQKPWLLSIFFYVIDRFCKCIFLNYLPRNISQNDGDGTIIFSEFPSLRRPRDKWIRKIFSKSIFFYCPHSPHIYTKNLDRKFPEHDSIDGNKKHFLLMGHPSDYFPIDKESEYAASDLEKVFIGHPKYSNQWLRIRQEESRSFRSSSIERTKANILVISRNHGSYLDEESHITLVEKTVQAIHNQIPNYNLFIKKHPREINSHWDNIMNDYPSIRIVDDHILDIACKVDFAITFWSSGAMDCFSLGVPVIEYWDPNKNPNGQVPDGDSFTTIYRKLGIAMSANNEQELERAVSSLVNDNYKMPLDRAHYFFRELITRSNQWDKTINKIISSHNLINN